MLCIIEKSVVIRTSKMEKKNVFLWKIKSFKLIFVLMLTIKLPRCTGQGRMIEPPMRSSMWRYGFNTPNNYQDDFLHCGGYQRYLANNESCGTCGDSYDGVRHNEAGGQYATGIVGRYFSLSDTHIPVTIELTGSYGGKFEFRLCPHNNVNEPVSQMCLDRYLLLIEEGVSQGTPYSFETKISGTYNLTVQIPDGMFCTQCVLQWKYRAENSLGIRPTKTECNGCNFREHLQNCADISIGYYPEILPNVAATKPSDHWTDQIKHLLQPDAYKFNSNGTKNVLLFNNITTNRSSILLSTIPSPSFPIISAIPSPSFPIISNISAPPFQVISTLSPLPSPIMSTIATTPSPIMSTIATTPSPIMSTRPTPPFQVMPPIPPPPFPIKSTSSKIELKSEHLFKIPPPPQTNSSEHPRVDGIATTSSKETSLHHAHIDGNIPLLHLHLPQNLLSNSDVSALNKQSDTFIKTGTVSTTDHDLYHSTFTTKKLELNLDKRIADNRLPSQAQASGAQSSSNMMHVSSSSITDSTNGQINTSREYLDDIETRIAIAELILADQLIAHEAGQNNTVHIENDLNTMKTKLVSLEDKLKKMENKLTKVATDLTKVKALTSPVKSSRKEIFRRIGLDFHFPKEKTTTVTTPAWDMKKRVVGKALEISKNVSKDENVINKVSNIALRKVIADLASNINPVYQNESIPETTTTANIDTWTITPQPILPPNDRVNPAKSMSLDIHTTRLLEPESQSALKRNGIHEPQKLQSNSHPSSSAIKSALVLNKHLPTESLPLRSSAAPVNALDLGRSIIDAKNTNRLTSMGELTVFQQPVQHNSSQRFNRIENMGIQITQGGADIQNRDKIVFQRDMNSAPISNWQRSVSFDSSESDTLQSRTRVMTGSSVQRTAEQVNTIPDRNIGAVSISSRETPELSARSQWQMIRTAQDVTDLRSSIKNGETNNVQHVVPSMSRVFNSGVGSSNAVQTNALLSRGSTQQSQQQREQINEQQLHSQQHSQQLVHRSSASLPSSFLNTASQVQTPLVRTFQPRTFMLQGQIVPFVPAQNRFVNQQFRAINTRSLGNINSQSQQPTVASMQPVPFFPIAGMF